MTEHYSEIVLYIVEYGPKASKNPLNHFDIIKNANRHTVSQKTQHRNPFLLLGLEQFFDKMNYSAHVLGIIAGHRCCIFKHEDYT